LRRNAQRTAWDPSEEENEAYREVLSNIQDNQLDSYFVGKHNGSKVRRIAERIN